MKAWRLILTGGILLSLAACGTPPANESALSVATPAPQDVKTEEKKTKTTALPSPAPVQPAAPEPVNDNPMQFMDMSTRQLSEAVGRPHMVRRDGPAEVWQYRGDGCVLDLFLYDQENELQVKHVDLRSQSLADDSLKACLADMIRKRNHTKPVG
ncbi:hypothetical protein [Aestuariispira insulae]|uniref:Lipoprotein n=1 Tax=Aestuariispira insulae TaxID=1461337 RepID=A0A3D9HPR8_9PROT|nr:hypothetical protein [Aestuariispira insulae]RED51470.1 hypothetical protein DFP90_103272 [Aestuariispira insulae]